MVRFKHSNGFIKEAPTGFSWTTLFFGFFVPLIRGHYGYAAICAFASIVTLGISGLVYPFIINKHYSNYLLEKGYLPASENDKMQLQMMGIVFDSNSQNVESHAA